MIKRILAVSLIFSFNVVAETEFKIITLKHHFASDLLPTIEPMVGIDGTAAGINSELIVRTSADRMREIEALIEKLDVVRENRKITINHSHSIQSQDDRLEANGNITTGHVTVRTPPIRPNTVNIELENNSNKAQQNSSQFLNVLDGERAFIRVGQIVPFTQEWITITRRYVAIERVTDWRDITTGFAVRTRTVGNPHQNLVEIEITPRIARLNQQGFIDFEELSTVVRTNLGSWVNISGTMQQNDDVSRKILGYQNTANQQTSNLSIKVD